MPIYCVIFFNECLKNGTLLNTIENKSTLCLLDAQPHCYKICTYIYICTAHHNEYVFWPDIYCAL